jgi:hypothetical protein
MIVDKLIFSKHLEKGEKILYAVHSHWIKTFKPVLALSFFGILIPWSLYFAGFNSTLFFWIAMTWSVMAYLRFIYVMLEWYANVWLVTSMSIIVIEWRGFFQNTAARIGYEDVEGVAYEINGFWGTIMSYGNLMLKVMSGNNMVMKTASNPKKAESAMARHQSEFLTHREMRDVGNLKALLSHMVSNHFRKE